jgi:PhnB protein
MAEQTPFAWCKRIIHATLALGDYRLTGADVLPESYEKPQGFSGFLTIGAAAEAERVFNSLAQNGTVQVPLQQTFWALHFGTLIGPFGTPWLINCGKPA